MMTALTLKSRPVLLKSILFWITSFAFMGAGLFVSQFVPKTWFWYSWGILGTINAFLASLLFLRKERKSFRDIGLVFEKATIPRFLTGMIIGGMSMASVLVLLFYFGGLHLSRRGEAGSGMIIFWSLALVSAALLEEIVFRSYTLKRLQHAYGLKTYKGLALVYKPSLPPFALVSSSTW